MTTGERIQTARKRVGMKQSDLAEKLGVAVITIGQYERDKRQPRLERLRRIAAVLGVDWTELVPEDKQGRIVIDHVKEGLKAAGPFKKISPEEAYRLGILNLTLNSEEDRIVYFYSRLNTDGKLAASKCFYQHLDKGHIREVADYVEKLSEIPQYQRPAAPQDTPALQDGKDTNLPADAPERPSEGE